MTRALLLAAAIAAMATFVVLDQRSAGAAITDPHGGAPDMLRVAPCITIEPDQPAPAPMSDS